MLGPLGISQVLGIPMGQLRQYCRGVSGYDETPTQNQPKRFQCLHEITRNTSWKQSSTNHVFLPLMNP